MGFDRAEAMFRRMYREDARRDQNGECAYCSDAITEASATADHVRAQRRGGTTTRENIKAACQPCNHAKAHMSERQFMKRVRSPQPGDGINIFLAHFRYRVAVATKRACNSINQAVGVAR